MNKCKDCKKPLSYYYYSIAGLKFCKECSLEMVADLSGYKINLHKERKSRVFRRGD